MEERACTLTDLYERGELPLRVTHNDTKINNVLFDEAVSYTHLDVYKRQAMQVISLLLSV